MLETETWTIKYRKHISIFTFQGKVYKKMYSEVRCSLQLVHSSSRLSTVKKDILSEVIFPISKAPPLSH